jgi:acyl-CoA synthetase (NDP forming)
MSNLAKPSLRPLIRPRSVALVGLSSKPGSAGHVVLDNLLRGGFDGQVHLVGRSGGQVGDRTVLTDVAQLPEGVDLAILLVPAEAVAAPVQALTLRGVKSALCFASGFAEMGEAGLAQQHEIARLADAGGLALLGPNTMGFLK